MSTDQAEAEPVKTDGAGATGDETDGDTNWSTWNWWIILLFGGLTVIGMALAVGVSDVVVATPDEPSASGKVVVPIYIFLYAGLGALGYIFTKLMDQIDKYDEWNELENLVAMGLRIPAAWILAAGVYLFIGEFGQTTQASGARFAAGVAFLVGLYVNVALKALGSLANRILGRSSRPSE